MDKETKENTHMCHRCRNREISEWHIQIHILSDVVEYIKAGKRKEKPLICSRIFSLAALMEVYCRVNGDV